MYNVQGDVVGIVAEDLGLVVSYEYNSWGRPTKTTGSLATTLGALNPFRYRGYCYDVDSGLTDLSDEEVSKRARDKSLPNNERQRYKKEEKARKTRNTKKRQSHY